MQVNVNGMWTEVPDEQVPQTLGWDDTLSANPQALGDNRGCPPGYFCEYVSGTFGGYIRVCRRFDQQIANNPAVLQVETGPGFYEQTQINVASAAQVVAGGLLGGVSAVALVGLGLLAFMWLSRR
jgi:hypothetical protein